MHDPRHELPTPQDLMTTTPDNSAARYGVGPSKGRSNAASAPGVAEAGLRREGAPEQEAAAGADVGALVAVRAADEAALYRVARRRQREAVQRKMRVDVRYSVDEHAEIIAEARRLNLAGAHFVGAVVMAHLGGDLVLPGQRTSHDDLIDELAALRFQVAAIGNNVNQIAFRLNSGGPPHPVDTVVLTEAGRILTLAQEAAKAIDAAASKTVASKRAA
ncbi:plasmid mobilization relaxosome protein MobC [Streptomyces sp. NPDC088146]|uniref:plasmid mobilization relaxosome protein MobC n=1 Tax=Streptomyces sp. NPDC088146 TaxID=3365829 RepID=UPI003820923A